MPPPLRACPSRQRPRYTRDPTCPPNSPAPRLLDAPPTPVPSVASVAAEVVLPLALVQQKHSALLATRPTATQWLWAASVVLSRSWGLSVPADSPLAEDSCLEKMHVLAPVADMVNHDLAGRKVAQGTDGGVRVHAARNLSAGDEVRSLRTRAQPATALRAVGADPRGCGVLQILISYGDKCNMELECHYGFHIPGNPVQLRVSNPAAEHLPITRCHKCLC